MKMELRVAVSDLHTNTDGTMTVSGYVNKTGQLSNVLGVTKRFVEKIAKGAFSRAIQSGKKDIEFLAEHKGDLILASTRNGSLRLTEDNQGLYIEATIASTSWGKDYYELINSGILRNMSFGFRTIKDSWRLLESNLYERTIEELELFEVSVVKNPAYSQSTIAARGIHLVKDIEVPKEVKACNQLKEKREMEKTVIRYGIEERTSEQLEVERFESFVMGKQNGQERDMNENRNSEVRYNTTGTAGGAVIPESVHNQVIKKVEEYSPIFEMARKFPSVAGTLTIAREDSLDDAGFVGEGINLKQLAMDFETVKLEQKRAGAYIRASNQLLNDTAISTSDYIADLLSRKLIKAIEKSILVGSGGNEFNGIVNDTFVPAVKVKKVEIDELMDLHNSLPYDYADGNAAFIMARKTYNQIAKLKDALGHSYVQNGIVNGRPTRTLFGKAIYITDVLPESTPVIFANFYHAYAIMIKQAARLQRTVDTENALAGTTTFVLDSYMDGSVYNPQAIAKLVIA
ncbi:phage major capsid protein [Bacillus wiedmannii]|uniref:phage major capsid protein n=1 Tax=Bacillus wiedmannii TaxID=1890302 RepID=UPI000BF87155|nr:phage major capsid protein [Bacillus wiedmannii]PGE55215.1 phage major capsid protein [Bacillus wiedmannii]